MFHADQITTLRLPPRDVQHTFDSEPPPLFSPEVPCQVPLKREYIRKKYDVNIEPKLILLQL